MPTETAHTEIAANRTAEAAERTKDRPISLSRRLLCSYGTPRRGARGRRAALATGDLERVVVDTTVQPKAIAHPTDARLCHRALEKLVDLARRHHVPLRFTAILPTDR
jgi:hypothetical protein